MKLEYTVPKKKKKKKAGIILFQYQPTYGTDEFWKRALFFSDCK